jgi:hypothetical protein
MAVLGNGPFEFTEGNGSQVSIPLGALKYSAGVLDVDGTVWPVTYSAPLPDQIRALLAEIANGQVLVPPVVPAAKPAMTITAADSGTQGNNIRIDITVHLSADLDPANATFDVTATESETYPGLTMATLESVVGTETPPPGSQPGVAHVLSGSVDKTKLPKDQGPLAFPDTPSAKATVDIKDDAATPNVVFTLEARRSGSGGSFGTASVSGVDTTAKTFTLQLQWSHSVSGATLSTLNTALAPLAYLITVGPPPSGSISVPASTSNAALSGGTATNSASALFVAAQ